MKKSALQDGAVLDVQGTLARFGGDHQLFQDIIGFYLEDSPVLLDELRQSVTSLDAAAIRSAAHALKGLASGCGGVRAARAAQIVENAGESGSLAEIDAQFDLLLAEFELLRRAAQACDR